MKVTLERVIETQDLTKVFRLRWTSREVRAADGIALKTRGTTFGLLGPNGAGKTTFVKMLLSYTHPTAGTARIFGHACSEPRGCSEPEARRAIGYLPENHRFARARRRLDAALDFLYMPSRAETTK
jgi:ABC-2 type transport system ATP-binding protein